MVTITFKGKAKVRAYKNGEVIEVTDNILQLCSKLDLNIDEYNHLANYVDGQLSNKISGGVLFFEYINGDLYAMTTYNIIHELTQDEINQLRVYTVGQWGDGLGESLEQREYSVDDDIFVYISAWSGSDQVVTWAYNSGQEK